MPGVRIVFFRDAKGVPVSDWLEELRIRNARAFAKCISAIDRLRQLGHELRRPEADHLGNGIYELRVRTGNVNYRILYFFYGREIVVLAHALTKEAEVPTRDIEKANERKTAFEANPAIHSD
ncbi:hypothetical protein PHYC_01142 [Phycisphaerales bacterium]|nr:hypothetical protein PHYC_01142 [Phycisphaerales bacterium]